VTDPSLWTIVRKFGVAGGPDVVVLTEEGLALAFQVGAQCRRGPALEALEALANFDGEALFCVGTGPRLVLTDLGRRFDQIAWGKLRSLGYVESVPPVHGEHGGGVRLTDAGRAAILRGFDERERLLARCRWEAENRGDP